MEDVLKKLDKLTQEEARMATAEVMRSTHAIDQSVKRVGEQVAEVINGAQFIKFKFEKILNLSHLDGKEAKKVMKQTAYDVDQTKRPSSNISLLRPTAFCTR